MSYLYVTVTAAMSMVLLKPGPPGLRITTGLSRVPRRMSSWAAGWRNRGIRIRDR